MTSLSFFFGSGQRKHIPGRQCYQRATEILVQRECPTPDRICAGLRGRLEIMRYISAESVTQEGDRRRLPRALIVTALGLELAAVRAHLKGLGSVLGRDASVYECGIFEDPSQDWMVVSAECGAGTHNALSAVTNAHVQFGHFDVLLFVGVAGSRKADAQIGTVVASSRVYFPYGGKYDETGRAGRPNVMHTDSRLLGLARKVVRDQCWQARIKPPLGGRLPAPAEYPSALPPSALVAPIASIEAVLAGRDNELEAQIARDYGDACIVEMEGYGAAFAAQLERTPHIIVRGVSDLASKKTPEHDAERQPVAACHAAAFAFEILTHWSQAYGSARPPLDFSEPDPQAFQGAPPPVVEPSRSRLVLNLRGRADDLTPQQLADLQDALRRVAGSDDIEILRVED